MSKRYNIGLLVAQITDDFSRRLSMGAIEAARAQDVNLIIFPGKYVGVQHINERYGVEYEYQYNVLFDIAAEAKLDYLIVAVGTIAYAHNSAYQKSFLDGLRGTPILSLAASIEGYDNLAFDNQTGIREAVDYLAAHGRKHIGMIAGDLNNAGFMQRYEAYRQALEKNGLAFKDSYMTPCDLDHRCYDEVERLLDQNPEMDAIVCATDLIAYDVYTVLERRNMRPGEDVAVVGFDDLPGNVRMHPPLASVWADAVQMGKRAVEKVVHVLRGVPDDVRFIESRFIPRRSSFRYVNDSGLTANIFRASYQELAERIGEYLRRRVEGSTLDEGSAALLPPLLEHLNRYYVEQPVDEGRVKETMDLLTEAKQLKDDPGLDKMLYGVYVWLQRHCPVDNVPYVEMLHNFFRAEKESETVASVTRRYEQRRHLDNEFIRDAQMYGSSLNDSYARPLKKLNSVGADSAFIYTLKEPIVNSYGDLFPTDLEWHFCSYSYGDEVFTPPRDKRDMTTPQVFDNDYLCVNRQHVFIVADLFAADMQYGIALLEPRNEDFMEELEIVTYQLSTAVRTLDFLRRQKKLVDELHATNKALEALSRVDELTGVYNRKGFFPAAEALLHDQRYVCQPFMVCFADMDNLKQINDTYGHPEGDFAIQKVAECLRYTLGEEAVIARMGGDEFAALVPAPPHVTVAALNGRKEHFIKRFTDSGEKPFGIGLTMGMFKSVCTTPHELGVALGRADALLYAEKNKNKNS